MNKEEILTSIRQKMDAIPKHLSESKITKMLLDIQKFAVDNGCGVEFKQMMIDDLSK